MLTAARQISLPFKEISIKTVYIDNNSATTFNPVRDSVKIYLNLFKSCRKKLVVIAATAAGIIISGKGGCQACKTRPQNMISINKYYLDSHKPSEEISC